MFGIRVAAAYTHGESVGYLLVFSWTVPILEDAVTE